MLLSILVYRMKKWRSCTLSTWRQDPASFSLYREKTRWNVCWICWDQTTRRLLGDKVSNCGPPCSGWIPSWMVYSVRSFVFYRPRQGNVFWQTPSPPGRHPTRQTPPPPKTATAADGTHPTGMHSCLFNFSKKLGARIGWYPKELRILMDMWFYQLYWEWYLL